MCRTRGSLGYGAGVEIHSLAHAEPFTTKDGSTIRELLGLPTSSARNQSLAEASLPAGGATDRHYHRECEEIYYLVEGSGEMELDGERRDVATGGCNPDPARRLAPIRADEGQELRFLCCCAPPYRHEDTFFA